MPDDAPLCIHCRKPIDLNGKDYMIVVRATMTFGTSTSGFYAHIACHRPTEPTNADNQVNPQSEPA